MNNKEIKESEAPIEEVNAIRGPNVIVEDIFLEYEHLFSDKAKEAYARPKINKLLPNTRYFSIMAVGENNIPKAAEKIANIINELADKNYIENFMHYFGCLELGAFLNMPLFRYSVYLWPILTPEGCAFVDANNYDSLASFENGLSKATISDPL